MRGHGHRDRTGRAEGFTDQGIGIGVHFHATVFGRHVTAQQSDGSGFLHDRRGDAGLLGLDLRPAGLDIVLDEIFYGGFDHQLLFVEHLWTEDVLWLAFSDQEFTATEDFGIG